MKKAKTKLKIEKTLHITMNSGKTAILSKGDDAFILFENDQHAAMWAYVTVRSLLSNVMLVKVDNTPEINRIWYSDIIEISDKAPKQLCDGEGRWILSCANA